MGMFDDVHFEMDCPKCGATVTGFQSKDLDCELAVVEPDALQNFYASCRSCGAWIEFLRPRPKGSPLREKSLTIAEVEALGFEMSVTPSVQDNRTSPASGEVPG